MAVHVVQKGDCITSIADQHGFYWETIWSHAENAGLRGVRSDPHTLMEHDRVFIPDLVPRSVDCVTARRHTFRRKGIPALVRVQIFDRMVPRKEEQFTLTLDDRSAVHGRTDTEGVLCVAIPTRVRSGTLVFARDRFTIELQFGQLAPIESLEGVQSRLKNLGFYAGAADGEESAALTRGITLFQTAYGLDPSGAVDDATRALLRDMHDERDRDPGKIKSS